MIGFIGDQTSVQYIFNNKHISNSQALLFKLHTTVVS